MSGSTFTTSAPQSARMPPQLGPATQNPSSTTLIPSIGPPMPTPRCCRSVVDRAGSPATTGDGVAVDGDAAGRRQERHDPRHLRRVDDAPDRVAPEAALGLFGRDA